MNDHTLRNPRLHVATGLVGCLLVSGCITLGPDIVPEKKTEIIVYSKTQQPVVNAVVQTCDSHGLRIDSNTENSVVCSSTADLGAQLVMHSKGGTEAQRVVHFNIFPLEKGTYKVTAEAALEAQNAFGRVDRAYQTGSTNASMLMSLLEDVKTKVRK